MDLYLSPDLPKLKRRKPRKAVTEHRRTMQRAYNQIYRMNQRTLGLLTRRQFAEALLQSVVRECCGPNPQPARAILAVTVLRLKSMKNGSDEPCFQPAAVMKRWKKLTAEIVHNGKSKRS